MIVKKMYSYKYYLVNSILACTKYPINDKVLWRLRNDTLENILNDFKINKYYKFIYENGIRIFIGRKEVNDTINESDKGA